MSFQRGDDLYARTFGVDLGDIPLSPSALDKALLDNASLIKQRDKFAAAWRRSRMGLLASITLNAGLVLFLFFMFWRW
jgi:hypothetical protein